MLDRHFHYRKHVDLKVNQKLNELMTFQTDVVRGRFRSVANLEKNYKNIEFYGIRNVSNVDHECVEYFKSSSLIFLSKVTRICTRVV